MEEAIAAQAFAYFLELRLGNCLKSRSVVSQGWKSLAYRSEMSPLRAVSEA
jgi:hypothetical protein